MTPEDREVRAAELATEIVASRVAAAAGRPNAAEGQDLAGYYRIVLRETRRALSLPNVTDEAAPE